MMGDKTTAFTKGGIGCLVTFAILGAIALIMGGSVHIDFGGGCCLFALGGILGLIVLGIYKNGQKHTDRD